MTMRVLTNSDTPFAFPNAQRGDVALRFILVGPDQQSIEPVLSADDALMGAVDVLVEDMVDGVFSVSLQTTDTTTPETSYRVDMWQRGPEDNQRFHHQFIAQLPDGPGELQWSGFFTVGPPLEPGEWTAFLAHAQAAEGMIPATGHLSTDERGALSAANGPSAANPLRTLADVDEGPEGPPGTPGADGADGPAGPQGPQGMPGADGADGAEGPTAVSVDAGNRAELGTDDLLYVPQLVSSYGDALDLPTGAYPIALTHMSEGVVSAMTRIRGAAGADITLVPDPVALAEMPEGSTVSATVQISTKDLARPNSLVFADWPALKWLSRNDQPDFAQGSATVAIIELIIRHKDGIKATFASVQWAEEPEKRTDRRSDHIVPAGAYIDLPCDADYQAKIYVWGGNRIDTDRVTEVHVINADGAEHDIGGYQLYGPNEGLYNGFIPLCEIASDAVNSAPYFAELRLSVAADRYSTYILNGSYSNTGASGQAPFVYEFGSGRLTATWSAGDTSYRSWRVRNNAASGDIKVTYIIHRGGPT